jgi:hypothetical protein
VTLNSTGIPKTHRFTTSKASLKRAFGDIEPVSVHMGSLQRHFEFDSRCYKRPRLRGPVVASASVSRELTAIVQLYPVWKDVYPPEAAVVFADKILPRMRSWLLTQLAKPATAVLGYEELLVEWWRNEHHEHSLRFL